MTVVEGGEPALATELARISRRDAAAGVRLACLTTVRRDLTRAGRRGGPGREGPRRYGAVPPRTVAGLVREIDLVLPAGETLDARGPGCFVQATRPPGERALPRLRRGAGPTARCGTRSISGGQMSAVREADRAGLLAREPARRRGAGSFCSSGWRSHRRVRARTCRRGSCRRTCSPSVPATRSPSRGPYGSSSFPTTTPIASWCSWAAASAWHRCAPSCSTKSSGVGRRGRITFWYGARSAPRPLLHGGVRPTVRRAPEFPVARRAVRSFPGRRLDRADRVRTPGGARPAPEPSSRARGLRVLSLRAAADDGSGRAPCSTDSASIPRASDSTTSGDLK